MFVAHTKSIRYTIFKGAELPNVNVNNLLGFYVKGHKVVWQITFEVI